jgi:tRNA(Arg) A34 adenosine deaminase TadA
MALVHSRVSRVFFGVPREHQGGFGASGASEQPRVHTQPGLNHHYEAFQVQGGILEECRSLLSAYSPRQ